MTTHAQPFELDHVTIAVGDLQRAEAFYVDLLGAELVDRFDRERLQRMNPERATAVDDENSPLHLSVRFGQGGPRIELFLQRGLTRRALSPHPHFAVRVSAAQLDRFAQRLQHAGLTYDGPRRLGGPGHASLYFSDPWGQLLELMSTDYPGQVRLGPPELDKLAHPQSS